MRSHFKAIASCFGKDWRELSEKELKQVASILGYPIEAYKQAYIHAVNTPREQEQRSRILILTEAMYRHGFFNAYACYKRIKEILAEQEKKPEVKQVRVNNSKLDIEKAKSVPIEHIIDIPLKRQGKLLVSHCPFHEDHHPSFVVYPDTNRYYCFGCGQSGSVIDYVMQRYNLTFKEAVSWLCQRA